jgi:hypothetical protein
LSTRTNLDTEEQDEGSRFIRNVGSILPDCTASEPRNVAQRSQDFVANVYELSFIMLIVFHMTVP